MTRQLTIIAICILLLLLMVLGCGDSPEGKMVVLPDGERSIACVIRDGRPMPIQELPFPSRASVPAETRRPLNVQDSLRVVASAFDLIDYNDKGWITYLAAMGTVVMVLKYDPDSGVTRRDDIRLPEGYAASTSAIVDDVMYVGCRGGGGLLGFYDLSSDDPSWIPMDVPDSIAQYGLSVGGLVVDDRRLIAITISNFDPGALDDIFYTKIFLTYDVCDPCRPKLLEGVRVREPGFRERILKAVSGARWLATFSETHSYFGRRYIKHITIYDIVTLREHAVMSNVERTALRAAFRNEDMDNVLLWESIGMLDDILLIAARDRGIAILDPAQIDTTIPRRQMTDSSAYEPEYRLFIAYPESRYLNFMPVPALDEIAVIITRNDSLSHMSLSKDELLTPDLWIDD